jgi:transmembrane sensor
MSQSPKLRTEASEASTPGPETTDPHASDEQDFESFASAQHPLDIQAATWAARARNGLDARGQAELDAWLAERPDHHAAFEDMQDMFDRLRAVPADEVAALKARRSPVSSQPRAPHSAGHFRSARAPISPRARRARGPGPGRFVPRLVAASAALSITLVGWMGWEHWRSLPTYEKSLATARGQQLRTELPDGSGLVLDTATQLETRLYRHQREVRLREGQAFFSIAADAARPFHVVAGDVRVTVVGTRFTVRHTSTGLEAGETRISVDEGRVRVGRDPAGPATMPAESGIAVELSAGQSVAVDAQGKVGAIAPLPPGGNAAWQQGRVSFDGVPLSQALAEFERYGTTGLVVRDPAVAAMPVGGSFQLRRLDGFTKALVEQLPVRLERRGTETEIVSSHR